MPFNDLNAKELTQSAPPIRRLERPSQARRANHAPRNAAAVNSATPQQPVEVKAELYAEVHKVKEEGLNKMVEFKERWPPIPPLDPRQLGEGAGNDAGINADTSTPPSLQRR